jgi:hypothetical protein
MSERASAFFWIQGGRFLGVLSCVAGAANHVQKRIHVEAEKRRAWLVGVEMGPLVHAPEFATVCQKWWTLLIPTA